MWKVFSLSSRVRVRVKYRGERKIKRKSERKVAPRALITSGGLLKLECLRLSPPPLSSLCVTIIISITWYYSRHFPLARVRIMRRHMHLAHAQMHTSEYVSAPLLSSKLLKTSWFLIVSAQRTSLVERFFLYLSLPFIRISLQNPGKTSHSA